MSLPGADDFIDIHTHGENGEPGIFRVQNLMAHEGREPSETEGTAFTFGIHPWHLNHLNHDAQLARVIKLTVQSPVIAVGEAGLDKIMGPVMDLQVKTFEEQAIISEELHKPLVVHCVRAWDELMAVHKKMKPKMNWLVHGFRGKPELAMQLISKGFYLSFWFDYIIRSEASLLIRKMPADKIFLETDGSGVDIRDIYSKVSADREICVEELKRQICSNYNALFATPGA